jgi:hypothetical protein
MMGLADKVSALALSLHPYPPSSKSDFLLQSFCSSH